MRNVVSDQDQVLGGARARHIPVLLEEVAAALSPASGQRFVDATFGAGGYTRALLDRGAEVVALDRDPAAIAGGAALAAEFPHRLRLVETQFSRMDQLDLPPVDGVVMDIGVSSMQLDQPERGFSFRGDGPLDMRMGGDGPSAADLVNHLPEKVLADVLYHYGEERASRALARAIVAARPLTSTGQLVSVIRQVIRTGAQEIHPATRSFQALRIAVNDELGELARALMAAERILQPGGVLAVVTFHSLEDRIVKTFFSMRSREGGGVSRHSPDPQLRAPTFKARGKAVSPAEAEVQRNPRARSARLRVGIRTVHPASDDNPSARLLPLFPEVERMR